MYRTYWSLIGRFDVFAVSLFITVGCLLFRCLSPPLSSPSVLVLIKYSWSQQMSQRTVVWCGGKGVGRNSVTVAPDVDSSSTTYYERPTKGTELLLS